MRYYSLVVLADAPINYYQLDETSGTTASDSSGNGNTGTYTGVGVTYGVSGAIVKDSDTAITFNGTSGDISLPVAGLPSGTAPWSIECWMNILSVPAAFNILVSWGQHVSGGAAELGINASGHLYVGFPSIGGPSQSVSPSTGAWHHVVGTSDGMTQKLYVDGALVASGTFAGNISTTSETAFIANGTGGSSWFNGSIDEVAIYNTVLNQQQISSHYTAGLAQLLQNFYYGTFQLNAHPGGLGYYLQTRDLDFPQFTPQLSPLALYDGYKITGYQVASRQIQCDLYIVGTSRADCIARKDTLEASLAKRDQQLVLHEDGRYWVANAIKGPAKFAAGSGVVQVKVPVTFVCANPYALAADAATPFDSGNVAYTTVVIAGSYRSPIFSVAGGGTIYTWPTITLTHQLATPGSTTLNGALTQGTQYTAITVTSAPALTAGQVIKLSWTTGGNTFVQKLVVSGTVTGGATSIPVNAFTASASFPITSTSVLISTAWNNVTIAQLTDNYSIQANGNNDQTYEIFGGNSVAAGVFLLPQVQGDFIIINCDLTASNGWMITGTVQGVSFTYQPNGAFPPLEPTTTQWQLTIASDTQPTADLKLTWTPRYTS